jgi:hypothetical protein
MKNIYLFFLFLPLLGKSQTVSINSFIGVRAGAAKEDAIACLSKFGAVASFVDEKEELVYLNQLSFEGLVSKTTYAKFVGDKFYEAIVEFDINKSNFTQTFNFVKQKLIDQYGYGRDFSWFSSPYYPGDGYELEAIMRGKGKLCHAWGNIANIESANFIVIEVCPDRVLRLMYRNRELALRASRKDHTLTSNYK